MNLDKKIKKIEAKISLKNNNKYSKIYSKALFSFMCDILGGLFVGAMIGYFLDKLFDTKPMFCISLSVICMMGGFYNFYKEYTKG